MYLFQNGIFYKGEIIAVLFGRSKAFVLFLPVYDEEKRIVLIFLKFLYWFIFEVLCRSTASAKQASNLKDEHGHSPCKG